MYNVCCVLCTHFITAVNESRTPGGAIIIILWLVIKALKRITFQCTPIPWFQIKSQVVIQDPTSSVLLMHVAI